MRWSVLIFVGFACSFSASTEEDTSEQPAIAFEFTMSGADELSGTIQVPVILSHAAETEVRVGYSLRDGNNATPGVDFELVTGTLVFAPGEQRKELPVRIMDDTDETEAVETFEIALSRPIGATLDEVRAIHSVRIADHILPRVTVGPGPTTASEASPTKLVIKLDRPSEGQSTVVIGVSGGAPAAASASDVTLLDGTQIVIPSGATSVNVPIGEKDDALDEEDHEIVVFTLRGASANLVIGTASSLAHAISDNDAPPTLGFTLATATLGEGGGAETAHVTLGAPSGRQVHVDYIRNAADTADAGDATVVGSPGTLTFEAGEMQKAVVVVVDNDILDEDDETVLVQLANPRNATLALTTHMLTIHDNDTAVVSFVNASSTVDEDAPGGINISVRLSNPSAKLVMVPFSLGVGTTASPSDFLISTPSPLVFAPGTTQLSIAIDVPDTAPNNESDERVVVELGTPTNAPLGSPPRHTLTIKE